MRLVNQDVHVMCIYNEICFKHRVYFFGLFRTCSEHSMKWFRTFWTNIMVDKLTLLFLSAELEMDDDNEINLEESVVTVVRDSSAVRHLFSTCCSRGTSESSTHGKQRIFPQTLGQHISTFRAYLILFSIRNPYINRFTNHFSIHS